MGDHTARRGVGSICKTDDGALTSDELLVVINENGQTIERTPRATIKGMQPLERPPAPQKADE
jgi:hypothetical protein